MSPVQAAAYALGVADMVALAEAAADAVEARLASRPTRLPFAIAPLRALADEGRTLIATAALPHPKGANHG